MASWSVAVDNGSFESAGITKDCQDAICELILNGFEAEATEVVVEVIGGELSVSPSITVKDNGTGIPFERRKETFGAFLSSEKRHKDIRLKSQANRGKGRYSYLALSHTAMWETVYERDHDKYCYTITLESQHKAAVNDTEPVLVDANETCGTTVTIPIVDAKVLDALAFEHIEEKLQEVFAWYLYLKGAKLTYFNHTVDVTKYIDDVLSKNTEIVIDRKSFQIDIVVWRDKMNNSSRIYYLDQKGDVIGSENTSRNRNQIDFYHAVYVRSDCFAEHPVLTNAEDESFIEYSPGQKRIMKELKKHIHDLLDDTLREFLVVRADKYFEELESNKFYPYFPNDELGQARKRDFNRVTKELYCAEPRIFYKLKPQQAKSLLGFFCTAPEFK